MSEESNQASHTPWHLWVVGIISLLWNGFGVFDFVATVFKLEFYLSQFPEEFLEYIYNLPMWMFVIWAVAIVSGFLGSVCLLLKNRLAVILFEASLLGALGSSAAGFLIDTPDQFKNYGMTVGILLIAVFLVVYSVKMKQKSVLK